MGALGVPGAIHKGHGGSEGREAARGRRGDLGCGRHQHRVALGGGVASRGEGPGSPVGAWVVHVPCEWRGRGSGPREEAAGGCWWRWPVVAVEDVAAEGEANDEWRE